MPLDTLKPRLRLEALVIGLLAPFEVGDLPVRALNQVPQLPQQVGGIIGQYVNNVVRRPIERDADRRRGLGDGYEVWCWIVRACHILLLPEFDQDITTERASLRGDR
jgi:hypothetical protein